AKKFSAEVSAAALVRGVTISRTYGSPLLCAPGICRRLTASRMHHSISRRWLSTGRFGELRQLARRGRRQTVFRRTGFNGERPPGPPGEQESLSFVRGQQIVTLL